MTVITKLSGVVKYTNSNLFQALPKGSQASDPSQAIFPLRDIKMRHRFFALGPNLIKLICNKVGFDLSLNSDE